MSYRIRNWVECELLRPIEERTASGGKRVTWNTEGFAWCGMLELRFFDLVAATFAGEGGMAKAVVRTTKELGPEWRLRTRDGKTTWEVKEVLSRHGVDLEVALRSLGTGAL